jgi:large subunit ribosomal protein L30
MIDTITVTLTKSMIGRPEKHRRILRSLGLKKMNRPNTIPDTASTRGQVQKVSHLVRVEEKL